jgi:hypothetical protein
MPTQLRPLAPLAALFLPGFLAACSGTIGDRSRGDDPSVEPGPGNPKDPGAGGPDTSHPGPGPVGPGPSTPGGPSTGPGSQCASADPGPSPLRRLTRVEYDNTVRMLFGIQTPVAAELFPADEEQFGFDNSAEGRGLNGALAEGYLKAAERLAKQAVGNLGALLACDPAGKGDAACLEAFLDGFGQRAWRRPLDTAEKDNLRQVFANGKGAGTFADGIDAVVQVMLLSPQFLYREERGVDVPGQKYQRLTSWELASRLSFLVWGAMPDDELFAAARDGKLSTREEIAAQARRMLGDGRALAMLTNFFGQWLELRPLDSLTKETDKFPQFKDGTAALMRRETESLVAHVLGTDAKLETLFTAPYTFMNATLASYYGVTGVTGDTFQKVAVDPTQRAGIVTQGGFLASHATPEPGLTALIFRGRFVREHYLCEELPEPPENAAEMSPPVTATTTPRSWSKARMAISTCGTCHGQIDTIGYGFELFDEIGLPRTGAGVDASGSVSGTDIEGAFNGPVELAHKLAGSKQARGCVATQWFRFAQGRLEDPTRDACSLGALTGAFDKAGGDLKELLVALTQTDAFLLRSKGDAP